MPSPEDDEPDEDAWKVDEQEYAPVGSFGAVPDSEWWGHDEEVAYEKYVETAHYVDAGEYGDDV